MSYLSKGTFRLDRTVYSPEVLFESIGKYSNFAEFQVAGISKTGCDVTVRVKPEFLDKEQVIKAEFLNHVLGSSILAKAG